VLFKRCLVLLLLLVLLLAAPQDIVASVVASASIAAAVHVVRGAIVSLLRLLLYCSCTLPSLRPATVKALRAFALQLPVKKSAPTSFGCAVPSATASLAQLATM
jgi:hypothetical protein